MSKKTFYITTPIYYPSGDLHIGHVYTTTLAWAISNYKKMMGYDVKFLTGADEHGQKIEQKAREFKMDTQEYVDLMSQKFIDLWKKMDIQYDYYSRTTSKTHIEAVSKQFTQLFAQGDIYKGHYKGLYSVSDEEFLTKIQSIEKNGEFFHPQSGHKLKEVMEESYFFRMSNYEDWWKKYIKENPKFIRPLKIVKELENNFINKGLDDLSITRSTFKWGIPINEDSKHVIYVWMDALNNYITALGYNSDKDNDFKKYWKNGDEIVHLVGKEIIRFHGIYWPIFLKAANIKLPTTIISHGWIITSSGKMSKSKGNVINAIDLLKKWDKEVIKYYFSTKIRMSHDGVFDEHILKDVYNSELANTYGNLVSRTIGLINQNFDMPVKFKETNIIADKKIIKSIINCKNEFIVKMDDFKMSDAYDTVFDLGKQLNGYIDITMPWTLKENKERLEVILNNLLNGIYAIFTMLSIVMPNKSQKVCKALGHKNFDINLIKDFNKFDNIQCMKIEKLFERIK